MFMRRQAPVNSGGEKKRHPADKTRCPPQARVFMGIRTTGFKSELKRGCRAERLTWRAALWRVHSAPFSLSNIGSVASFWLARLTAPRLSFAPIILGLLLISSQRDALLLPSRRRDALQSHEAVFDYTFSGFRARLWQRKRLNMCLICRACDKWLLRGIYYIVHMHAALQLFPASLVARRVDFCLKLWSGLRAAFASRCRGRLWKIVLALFSLSGRRHDQSVARREKKDINNKNPTERDGKKKTASFSFRLHQKCSNFKLVFL